MDKRDRQFFQPVWRRLLVVILLSIWTAVEWWAGNSFWGTLLAGALGISIWMFTVGYSRAGNGAEGQ